MGHPRHKLTCPQCGTIMIVRHSELIIPTYREMLVHCTPCAKNYIYASETSFVREVVPRLPKVGMVYQGATTPTLAQPVGQAAHNKA